MTKTSSVRMLTLSAIFVVLLTVGAYLKVPVPMWPFTLQTMFAVLAGLLLGKRYGALACLAYIILGLAGVPIFTGGGGLQYVFQPTFGCLIGFAVGAFVSGSIVERSEKRTFQTYFLAAFAQMAVIYCIGMLWFWGVKAFYLHTPIGAWTLFITCFAPTIWADILKAAAAAWLAVRLSPALTFSV